MRRKIWAGGLSFVAVFALIAAFILSQTLDQSEPATGVVRDVSEQPDLVVQTATTLSPLSVQESLSSPTTAQTAAPVVSESVEAPFPVYDTAWQIMMSATPEQADEYFRTLSEYGFTGAWAGVIHHAPVTFDQPFNGGSGPMANFVDGDLVLSEDYAARVREILDAAHRHSQKVGLVIAWQQVYLPAGPDASKCWGNHHASINPGNAAAYGRQMVELFGDHPAVSSWVLGGDGYCNNNDQSKSIWSDVAQSIRSAGSTLPIGYHTPGGTGAHRPYVGEPWLDFIAPQTGHNQGPEKTLNDLRDTVADHSVPVWQGEPRYFNIDMDFVKPEFKNPGTAEVVADARAAKEAGVSGYLYGDGGRWHWCVVQNFDASPCDANRIADSFGEAERQVLEVFR